MLIMDKSFDELPSLNLGEITLRPSKNKSPDQEEREWKKYTFDNYRVSDLKNQLKKLGGENYSRLKKADLIDDIWDLLHYRAKPSKRGTPALRNAGTIAEIKQKLRKAGISGYSKLKKPELLQLLDSTTSRDFKPAKSKKSSNPIIVIRKQLKTAGISVPAVKSGTSKGQAGRGFSYEELEQIKTNPKDYLSWGVKLIPKADKKKKKRR